MMRKLVFVFVLLLGACASPEPDYYTLGAVPGSMMAGPKLVVEIRQPSLPDYLDRPEMIEKSGYRVSRDDGRIWAAPLDGMVERVLAADIGQRLSGGTVFTETDALGIDADYKVDVDIQQFEADRDGHSSLTAQVVLVGRAGTVVRTEPALTVQGSAASTGASMAATFSQMLGQVADHVAADLRAVPPDSAGESSATEGYKPFPRSTSSDLMTGLNHE
jgi:uncharacterized lipoprotein YmbA